MQTLTEHTLQDLAARMLRDYDERQVGRVFADGLQVSLRDGRRLQDAVAALRVDRGESVVGYKVGCMAPENQRELGVAGPVWGRLWSSEQHFTGARLSRSRFDSLAIEGEFAVTLARNIDPSDVSMTSLQAAVDRVVPVIELHHARLHGTPPRGAELIANNAIHAGVVRGPGATAPDALTQADLTVRFDERIVGAWSEIGWPQQILGTLEWLSGQLAEHGLMLIAGQTVLTGALGPPLPVITDCQVRVTSDRFGSVDAFFESV